MKKLPIGIQSFVNIRTEADYYYVDKTRFVAELADRGKYFFLSRPRRFGKSLFLDTLRQAFLARKELFQGLYLADNWDWSAKYPVILVSFGSGVHRNIEELQETMRVILKRHAEEYQVSLENTALKDRFFELIQRLSEKHGQKVVILIDEYDKPILDRIDKPEIAIEIREELKNFYSVIKDADEFLKFVFITGVSKFSKVSLFSGLNNLQDLTLDTVAATLCGYTHEELIDTFAERLGGVDTERVRQWYNGYNFLGDKVYNPFDVLLFLDSKEFRNYWFETGSPSFLIKLIAQNNYPIPDLEHIEASEDILSSFDIDDIKLETILFQTGYLTIRDWMNLGEDRLYTLSYPNLEVKKSLTENLLRYLTGSAAEQTRNRINLYRCLAAGDMDRLRDIFHAFFASIPYDWYRKNELAGYEAYYASIFYCYFTALGLDVTAEEMTNKGRIDMAVRLENKVFILEFKVVEIDRAGKKAIEQIKEKRYWERYQASDPCACPEIHLIGVEFSSKDRNITGFDWERVQGQTCVSAEQISSGECVH
ncbi:ATP-binding protein [Dissulfurimicrobium hydrothermale]|uniref:ATP-binding protein n=1 Tax=Dissulfurimicrobium hydrothermale TaxID=1750598 RepID=UPI001EDB785C|nr:ATP-binding protein [Dissulfurimicrobium hydrothermale]UKL13727.1 ATP-binding protein [Dissulfurimicrobium hydrothermale]